MVVASVIQLLLAAGFLVIPYAHRHGGAAQRAAERQVAEQGLDPGLLVRHRTVFTESAAAALFPVLVGLCFVALAWLDLAGVGFGVVLSLVVQSLMVIGGGLVTGGQVFAARSVTAMLRKSDDESVRGLDGRAVVAAAQQEFPAWLRVLIPVRFGLVTVGSAVVIVLLALTLVS